MAKASTALQVKQLNTDAAHTDYNAICGWWLHLLEMLNNELILDAKGSVIFCHITFSCAL